MLGAVSAGYAQKASARLEVMKEEMVRNFDALQQEPVPPYYISYSIDEVRTQGVAGSFGAITNTADNRVSYLRIDVCTGSYQLDSSQTS